MESGEAMKCEQAKTDLTALERGELDEEEAQRVRAHLEECEQCAADLGQMEAAVSLLRSLEAEPAPNGFAERVMQRLPERRGWEIRIPVWKLAWGGGIAAVAVALVYLGIFLGQVGTNKRLARLQEGLPQHMGAKAGEGGTMWARARGGVTPAGERGALGPFGEASSELTGREEGLPEDVPRRGSVADMMVPPPARPRGKEPELVVALPPEVGLPSHEAPPPGEEPMAMSGGRLSLAAPAPVADAAMGAPVGSGAEPAAPATATAEEDSILHGATEEDGALAEALSSEAEVRWEEKEVSGDSEPAIAVVAPEPTAERRFPLRLEGADLVDALRLMASLEGRTLEAGPDVKGTVTLRMRNATAEEVLEKLKKGFDLSVHYEGETMIVRGLKENSRVPGNTAIG